MAALEPPPRAAGCARGAETTAVAEAEAPTVYSVHRETVGNLPLELSAYIRLIRVQLFFHYIKGLRITGLKG